MTFVSLTADRGPLWDEIVSASDEGWLFGLFRWVRMLPRIPVWGFQDRSFMVFDGDRAVAAVPLQLTPQGRLCSNAMGPGGAMLATGMSATQREAVQKSVTDRLLEIARSDGAWAIEVYLCPMSPGCLRQDEVRNPLVGLGFEDCSTSTWALSLSPPVEELFRGLSENARRKIKEAKACGYRVRPLRSRDEMDVYYEIHRETYQRTGAHPHPKEYFLGIYDEFTSEGLSRIWAAEDSKGRIAGFFNVAVYKKQALYWTSCCRDADFRMGVYYLLIWEAIQAAKEEGLDYFDCGEAFPDAPVGSKERGLSDFKRKFGGKLRPFYKGRKILGKPKLPIKKRVHLWLGAAKRRTVAVLGERTARAIGSVVWVPFRAWLRRDG